MVEELQDKAQFSGEFNRIHRQTLFVLLLIIMVEELQGVAQFGSVPVLGTGGRRFKSCHLEFLNKKKYLI